MSTATRSETISSGETASVATDLTRMFKRELEGFRRELDMFPDDASIWTVVPGITNSAATLALHVAGALRYMVGAVLGGSGYVRDRDAEFSRRGLTRAEVKAELDLAEKEIEPALLALDEAALAAPFPGPLKGMAMSTQRFLIAFEVHAGFHLAQAGYLRRIVTGDNKSSDPIPTEALSDV